MMSRTIPFSSHAKCIEAFLAQSLSLQKRLEIYDDIYTINRIFDMQNGFTNRKDWLQQLVAIWDRVFKKYCEKDQVDNAFVQDFLHYLFEIRQLLLDFPVDESEQEIINQLHDDPERFKRRASIECTHTLKGYRVYTASCLQQLLKQVYAPGLPLGKPFNLGEDSLLQVQLLGGTDVLAYRVDLNGGAPMMLKLYKFGFEDSNQEALEQIRRVAPEILDDVYYRGGAIGEAYTACEFSEYFAGGSFSQYIEKLHARRAEDASFTGEQKQRLFSCFKILMIALHKMHKEKCYFTDIKPDNLLFDKDPFNPDAQLKISDKKSANRLIKEKTANAVYTIDFAAPEMIAMHHGNGDPIDPRPHDFYALAVTMLRAITGKASESDMLGYEPRDRFEKTMLEVLRGHADFKGMLTEDPVERLDFITRCLSVEKLSKLERELFSESAASKSSATFFGATYLKCRIFSGETGVVPSVRHRHGS